MPSKINIITKRLAELSERSVKMPKYRQLSEVILAMIDNGDLKPGDHLPAEITLAESLPFSLGTVQKALRSLSELGTIKRTQRRGTIISGRTPEIFDLWQFRFIDEDENSVFPVFSHVATKERIRQSGPWSRFLGDDDYFIKISREIDVDHQFKSFSSFYLSNSQFGKILDLEPAELEGVHLSAVVQRMFGVTTVRTNNRVICSVIPDPICLRLELPSGARGLVCEILGFGPNDKPLSFQQVYIPADAPPMEFRELKPTWSS